MIGTTLKRLLEEQNINVSELARRTNVSAQTLYSIIRRDNMKIDFDLLLRICDVLDVPVETFCERSDALRMSAEEQKLLRKLRALDVHGREITLTVMDAELARMQREARTQAEAQAHATKIIPLYATPAAAGYASPALGDDYEDYEVEASTEADFAVRIAGDSMEPYIHDDSIVFVKRGATIRDGDVGLFFVDGDMKCKQYCQDYLGNVYLFSANRARKDADVEIPASSGITLCCFGKVLLKEHIPLPVN
ncbi:MAG: S24 family peptidase [Oscillospiraceae bacterium]